MMNSDKDHFHLQALLLVDHIYRDQDSGKYILAGIFHRVFSPNFPTTFGRTVGIFISLRGLVGEAELQIQFIDLQDGKVLMRREAISILSQSPDLPVELAVEVPQLPLPHAGNYVFRVLSNGVELGEIPVNAQVAENQAYATPVVSDRNG